MTRTVGGNVRASLLGAATVALQKLGEDFGPVSPQELEAVREILEHEPLENRAESDPEEEEATQSRDT